MQKLNRRNFIRLAGGMAGAFVISSCAPRGMMGPMMQSDAGQDQLLLTPVTVESQPSTESNVIGSNFVPDLEIKLRAIVDDFTFTSDVSTPILRYVGELVEGTSNNLTEVPNSFLGPTIRVKRGQKVRVHLINELATKTIIHWHGQHLPEDMDGHPLYAVDSGETYTYEFEVTNRAGTYWYHPHPDKQTGAQVYFGLAGLFIIEDEAEEEFNLPTGEFDLPLVIHDRTFQNNGELQYVDNGHQIMVGFWANSVLINGQLNYTQNVSSRPYRLRLLNGSNARLYKIAWDDGSPMKIIGTDGGLLAAPVERDYITLAAAERLDLWVDFKGIQNGETKSLIALPFEGGNQSMVELVRFEVTGQVESDLTLPVTFAPLDFPDPKSAINYDSPRQFDFFLDHMTPVVDGKRFELNDADPNETVKLNTLEIWEVTNDVNGANGFPHPIHIHGVQFQVVERSILPQAERMWDTVKDGYVDEGWKDTVLLMPGERAKLCLKFEDYTGLFLFHCHNLEHEDGGMMRNYRVEI